MLSHLPHAWAQGSIWLDGVTSTAQPPAGVVETQSSAYLLLGMHGDLARAGWKFGGAANYGAGFATDSARWLWGDVHAERAWYGPRISAVFATNAYGLRYTDPFEYSAYAAELWPRFSVTVRSLELTAIPRASVGRWQSGPDAGDIAVYGGGLRAGLGFGSVAVSVLGESYHATNAALDGNYRGAGLEAAAATGNVEFGATVKRWRNPADSEWGYSAFVTTTFGSGLQLDLQAARSVTDPVLASPGSFGASVGLSWRVFSRHEAVARPVAAVGGLRDGARLVTFTVEAATAGSMSLSGTFSDWQPIEMLRNGQSFTVQLSVAPGIHHYGFLVNGTDWYVPEHADGLVADGFGRRNATLVIERE